MGYLSNFGLPSLNYNFDSTKRIEIYHPVNDWNVQFGSFIGLTNMFTGGFDLSVCYLIKNKLSLGVGITYNHLDLKITSFSDNHLLKIGMIPYYTKFDYIFDNSIFTSKSYYLTGRFGSIIYHKTSNVNPRQIHKPYWELGAGILGKSFIRSEKEMKDYINTSSNFRLEFALQQYRLSGIGESSYNSTIDFNLRHTLLVLRFIVCI